MELNFLRNKGSGVQIPPNQPIKQGLTGDILIPHQAKVTFQVTSSRFCFTRRLRVVHSHAAAESVAGRAELRCRPPTVKAWPITIRPKVPSSFLRRRGEPVTAHTLAPW